MMIGIECTYTGTLKQFLKDIPIDKYDWYISENEIIHAHENVCVPQRIGNDTFKKVILDADNMILFMNLKAYLRHATPVDINNYNDFINSSCEMILLVSDETCWEVYAKDHRILSRIISNISKVGCLEYTEKQLDKDDRTIFSVI